MFDISVFDDKQKFYVGLKEALKQLKKNNVETLIYAEDADSFVTRIPINIAKKNGVDIIEIPTKKELGKICNIDISAAIAVVIIEKK